MCPLTQGNPILSETATFQNNGKITNPSRHPAVMSGNSLAALMPLMAWRGFPGHFPNDLLAFKWDLHGCEQPGTSHCSSTQISCSIKPWNGLGWDEPQRPAGSTLLPKFLQSSILPGQAFPSTGALPTSQEYTNTHPTTLWNLLTFFPLFQTRWLGWRPGHCQVLTVTSSPRGVVSTPELPRLCV